MKKLFPVILGIFLLSIVLVACDDGSSTSQNNVTSSTSSTSNGNIADVCSSIQYKEACQMVVRRYGYLNDANKYGYFYGFVPGTNIVQEYVVQGGIFPTSDLISNPNYQEACNNYSSACAVVLDKQQPDGTYGTNGGGVFGFRADGAYFEWDNAPYEYSETPITMPTSREVIVVGCKSGIKGC